MLVSGGQGRTQRLPGRRLALILGLLSVHLGTRPQVLPVDFATCSVLAVQGTTASTSSESLGDLSLVTAHRPHVLWGWGLSETSGEREVTVKPSA